MSLVLLKAAISRAPRFVAVTNIGADTCREQDSGHRHGVRSIVVCDANEFTAFRFGTMLEKQFQQFHVLNLNRRIENTVTATGDRGVQIDTFLDQRFDFFDVGSAEDRDLHLPCELQFAVAHGFF